MASSLDMSLDDRVRNRSDRGRGRGRGRDRPGHGQGRIPGGGRPTGPVRSGPLMVNVRPLSHAIAKPQSCRDPRNRSWHEIELFSEIGDLKRYAVHYNKNGHPSGSAEVVYTRRSDTFAALKRYNNVLLDGKPMKIEIVGANAELPITARINVTGINGKRKRTVIMKPRGGRSGGPAAPNHGAGGRRRGARHRSGGIGRGQGNGRGRGGVRGQGHGRKDGVKKSAEELDKELETYHAEAMHIS